MLAQSETLTFERTMGAEPREVYRAFTTPQGLRDWLCDAAEVDPRKGGRFFVWWDDGYYSAGTITDLTKGEKLTFTWRGPTDHDSSEVHLSLAAKNGGTLVEIEHTGLASEQAAEAMRRAWEAGLENLQSVIESGKDLRFIRRPMFGLSGADVLNAETVARLGVPVKEGIWLDGLVEGMGAQKAGFQKDDVLVSLDGHAIANFNDFRVALDPHRAGDHIEAIFYRGPERHVVDMELSARPIADFAATPEELGTQARANYAEIDNELSALFEGVTEAEADYRTAPDEWNAKEIVAHLIGAERDMQTWVAGYIDEGDVENVFHSNGHERMKAIVSAYPTVALVTEELRREEAMLAELIATLPPKTAANKAFYFQLGNYVGTFQIHHREHFGNISRLIDEARSKNI